MSVSQNVGGMGGGGFGAGMGVSSLATITGAFVLPNTGDQTTSILAIVAMVVGATAFVSQGSLFLYKRFVR